MVTNGLLVGKNSGPRARSNGKRVGVGVKVGVPVGVGGMVGVGAGGDASALIKATPLRSFFT